MGSSYDPGTASLYFQTVPASGNDLVSFYIDDFQLTYVPPPTIQTEIPSIYKTFPSYFPIGAAIDTTDLSGPHAQLLTMHFDSMTPGNDMKWSSVEATQRHLHYTNADAEVGLAECTNMRVRGQNLVWSTGAQTPAYAFGDGTNSAANQAAVTANIQEHIQSEVQHFGNKVYAWDVVNEPLDPTQPDCLEHGPFYQVLGASYIDIAFKAAKQYAPAGNQTVHQRLQHHRSEPPRVPGKGGQRTARARRSRRRHRARDAQRHQLPSTAIDGSPRSTPCAELPRHRSAGDRARHERLQRRRHRLELRRQHSAIRSGRTGLALQAILRRLPALRGQLSEVTIWGMADDDTWLDSFPSVAQTIRCPSTWDCRPSRPIGASSTPQSCPAMG